MEKGVYFICLVFVVQNVLSQSNSNDCFTPDDYNGVCITLKRCPRLKLMVETQRNNATIVAFIKKSWCGYDGKDPKVCCQLENEYTSTQSFSNIQEYATQQTGFIGSSGYETVTSPKLPSQKTCGRTETTHVRVVGGQPAELGAWPWMTAIGYTNRNSPSVNYQWLCGGSLISDRYVVTAAHCTVGLGSLKISVVRLGDLDLDPNKDDGANPIDYVVNRVITHESYNAQQFTNDIALLKLDKTVSFNTLIRPICLPIFSQIRQHKLVKTAPFVSGWGATSHQGPTSTQLMEVQLPVLDNADCKKAFEGRKSVIDDRIICAGDLKGGRDSCQGDSGGPLMWPNGNQYYLVGIVSYGFKCAEKGYPGVYTRTTSFVDWIVQTMNKT